MRVLRTLIIGAMMVLPGMFLAYLVWLLAGNPATEPLETLICNGIPLLSISLGLFFGWKSGEEYSVKLE
jgi:hypothetical protein